MNSSATQFGDVLGDINRVNWTQAGVERHNGASATRYEAGGIDALVDAGSVAVPRSDPHRILQSVTAR